MIPQDMRLIADFVFFTTTVSIVIGCIFSAIIFYINHIRPWIKQRHLHG